MAMDALDNFVNNVPDWLQRLDDLSGQIDRRQAELAAVAAAEEKIPKAKSLLHGEGPKEEDVVEDATAGNRAQTPVNTNTTKVHTPSPGSIRQQQEIVKTTQARAPAVVKKKPKSPSMMSNEDTPAAYRTRSMIIVYYDSYVQGFFDELVRFV
ncbi:hypothetical protein ACHAO7_011876 [Fusarium culmorum]